MTYDILKICKKRIAEVMNQSVKQRSRARVAIGGQCVLLQNDLRIKM